MKVFISWSGKLSYKVAEAFNDWLPQVIQSVETFFSPEIEKGKKWLTEIPLALEECDFGIICLTPNNLDEPWILFESGALAKKLNKSNVATFIVDLDSTDVEFPLAMFQDTKFEKEEVFKLVQSVNNNISKGNLKPDVLKTAFEKFWPDLEKRINEALASKDIKKAEKRKRPNSDLLTEILQIVRGMQGDFSKSKIVRLSDLTRKEQRPLSKKEFVNKILSIDTNNTVDYGLIQPLMEKWLHEYELSNQASESLKFKNVEEETTKKQKD